MSLTSSLISLYLTAGQSYEIRMLNQKLLDETVISSKYVKVGGITVAVVKSKGSQSKKPGTASGELDGANQHREEATPARAPHSAST